MQSGNQRDDELAQAGSNGSPTRREPVPEVVGGATPGPGAPAQMARFYFPDQVMLEIHIPGATGLSAGESVATEAGFILRRGKKVLNVGPLRHILRR